MAFLLTAIIAFIVAGVTASAVAKARQGADTVRLALLEQRVEELSRLLGHTPASISAPLSAPPVPNLTTVQSAVALPVSALAPSLTSSVAALLAQGKKINAIKIYRDQTGVGLKEAKDAVEEIERQGATR